MGVVRKMDCGSSSFSVDDELEKLFFRTNQPRVTVDNDSSKKATLVMVDGLKTCESLLVVVQVLTDMNLMIRRGNIVSDREWFMDVFHVTDQKGNKLSQNDVAEWIQQSLDPRIWSFHSWRSSVGVQAAMEHTTIELTGRDRPGLLSEVFAVLANLKCNVVTAVAWTHNSRIASVIYITDEVSNLPINDSDRLAKIKQWLLSVLKGGGDEKSANIAVTVGFIHTKRRLHQLMYADCDFDVDGDGGSAGDQSKVSVTVDYCTDTGHTIVKLRCQDRPKLVFDTVCALTDMGYVVYHGTVIAEGPEACQEYYIRHTYRFSINSEAERQRVIDCLGAAIKRRTSEGIKLELCCANRVGLLSNVTRIFRENGLSVTRAKVTTRGSHAVGMFYVTDYSGNPFKSEMIEAVREQIGLTILRVKDESY